MKRYLAAAMLLLALSGCGSSGSSTQLYTTTEDFFAMDTYMSVDVSSEKSESAAEDMAVKIEQRVNQLDAAHAAGGRSLQAEPRERSADRSER